MDRNASDIGNTSEYSGSDFDDMGAPKEESILLKNSLNTKEDEKTNKYPFPKGVFYIIATEFCERFSFYGMRAILVMYLTQRLDFSRDTATVFFHSFTALCYIMPLFGAILADSYFGRYNIILYLSVVYLAGNVIMAVTAMAPPFWLGPAIALTLIGIGTGGIKPCVNAFGGDQFNPDQTKQLDQFFSFFYLSINVGSFLSTVLTPFLRAYVHCFGGDCYPLAFGVPAVLMAGATLMFFCGRSTYKIAPPEGNLLGQMLKCTALAVRNKLTRGRESKPHWLDHAEGSFEPAFIEDMKRLMMVLWLFLPLPIFWALFDQQGSRWTLQAKQMDGYVYGDWYIQPDQMQALNPVLIVLLIPLSETVVYPLLGQCGLLQRQLQRMGTGMVLAALSFVIAGVVQLQIQKAAYISPGSMSAVTLINNAPCNLTIQSDHFNQIVTTYKAAEKIFVPSGNVTMLFTVDKLECPTMTVHSTSLRLNLHAKHGYCIIIGNRNGQLVVTYFDYSQKKAKHGRGLVNVVYMEHGSHHKVRSVNESIRHVILADSKDHRYTYNTSDYHSAPFTHVVHGKYNLLAEDNVTLSSGELEVKDGGVYTVVVRPNLDTHKLEAVEVVNQAPSSVSVLYQIPQYLIMTMGEILFSISGLQLAYSQSPASMKSVLQASWLLTVAVGNILDVVVAGMQWVRDPAMEFFMFAGLMTLMLFVFGVMAHFYKYVVPSSEYYMSDSDNVGLVESEGSIKLGSVPRKDD